LACVPSYRPDLGPPWTVPRVLWSTMSRSRMLEGIQRLRDAGDEETFKGFDSDGPLLSLISADEDIAAAIDGTPYVAQKLDAMRAHATQITADGPFFAGADILGQSMWSHEFYRLAAGQPFPDADQWADDLFAGLN
jgi:N-acetyl-1-D-myo-inositol-2-amino-2-deoxy-alpha-D-glucopyranoside deacetylase